MAEAELTPEPWHGTLDGYSGRGCRCDRCRGAKSAHAKQRHQEFGGWLNEIKSQPCTDCGGTFPAICMDFDHRDPATKSFVISHSGTRRRRAMLAEIAKCDVVCANCHRIRTARQHSEGGIFPGRPRKV